jgi:hypothetical protein
VGYVRRLGRDEELNRLAKIIEGHSLFSSANDFFDDVFRTIAGDAPFKVALSRPLAPSANAGTMGFWCP